MFGAAPPSAMIYGDPAWGLPGWWAFEHPVAVLSATQPNEVLPLLTAVERACSRGQWAVGFVGYEAAPAFDPALKTRPAHPGLPLAWFGFFPPPSPVPWPQRPRDATVLPALEPSLGEVEYLRAVAHLREHIARGDTYQANLTYQLTARGVHLDAGALFVRLAGAQATPYGAWLDLGAIAICSASPELFFRLDGDAILCRPMKGTALRGRYGAEDAAFAAALTGSPKERAENVMIVDMIRNDLGRVARRGSVEVPRQLAVERYPTVLQMTSEVRARTDASLPELFTALFPCASITGAPKVRTMELLTTLETSPRGVYTGALGFVAPGRRARFSVAIRTAWVDRTRETFHYGTGSGVVWDSVPSAELAETRAKTRVLLAPPSEPFRLLETLRWDPRRGYWLLDRHLTRLLASADYFQWLVPRRAVEAALEGHALTLPPCPHRVRLRVDAAGRCEVESEPLPSAPRRPWRLALHLLPVDPTDPFLFHKTTRRRVYDLARAAHPTFDDVVLQNGAGELTESTLANLVVRRAGALLTPPLQSGLLAGVFRAELLAAGRLREEPLRREDLIRAERVYLINSVRGWIPARWHPAVKE